MEYYLLGLSWRGKAILFPSLQDLRPTVQDLHPSVQDLRPTL
jgi:hypothetical protein